MDGLWVQNGELGHNPHCQLQRISHAITPPIQHRLQETWGFRRSNLEESQRQRPKGALEEDTLLPNVYSRTPCDIGASRERRGSQL